MAFLTVMAQVMGYLAPLGVSEGTFFFVAKKPDARPKLLANLLLAAFTGAVVVAAIVVGALVALPALRPSRYWDVRVVHARPGDHCVGDGSDRVIVHHRLPLVPSAGHDHGRRAWLYPLGLVAIRGGVRSHRGRCDGCVGGDLRHRGSRRTTPR